MKGMELAKAYFEEYGIPMIETSFSQYQGQIAAGLVGEGSECLGYDDEFSQDHDFGPGFCVWIPEDVYREIGNAMQAAYDSLPKTYRGFTRIQSAQADKRVGIFSLERFYQKYTGLTHAPKDNLEWFRIPESFLATAVNGQVFRDPMGTFSQIRSILKDFYPLDVMKKKLAARAAVMAQAGQYNYPRCMKRGDSYAAYLACGEFVRAALSAIYLLNERYMPFYKWAFRGVDELKILSGTVHELKELVLLSDEMENRSRKEWLIEDICIEVGRELNRKGFTRTTDAFLQSHGEELMRSIRDQRLSSLPIMVDCR